MVIKGILDIQVECGIMKILCEFDNNKCQVIEFPFEFDGIEINHTKKTIESLNFIIDEKCNITIPIKLTNKNCLFILRDWK